MNLRAVLTESSGGRMAGTASRWPRRVLVVAQVAMSVTLLVGAGLLIRTVDGLLRLRAGVDGTHVTTAVLSLQDARYQTAEHVNRLFDRTLERMHAIPGVESAAVALTLPYERALNVGGRLLDGTHSADIPLVNLTYVTPEYFTALRIPIMRGRGLAPTDDANGAPVIVVNMAFVRRYAPDHDVLGTQFSQGGAGGATIVGIVGDIQQKAWGAWGPLAPMPAAYVPAAQQSDQLFTMAHTWFSPSWIVRTSGPQANVASAMQRAVQAVDPLLPFAKFRTLDDVRAEAVATQRAQTLLLGTLAGLALMLAAIGLYGLVASSVTERTRELGIRMALGSTPTRTLRVALTPGLLLGVMGLAIGVALARAGSSLMVHLIWGVPVSDPVTFALASSVVLLVVGLATFVPAWRVLRINPLQALRNT